MKCYFEHYFSMYVIFLFKVKQYSMSQNIYFIQNADEHDV